MQKHQILDDDSDVSRDVPVAMETPTESSNLIQLDIHLPRYDMPKEVIDLREKRKSVNIGPILFTYVTKPVNKSFWIHQFDLLDNCWQ